MNIEVLRDEYRLLDDLSFTTDHTLHGLSKRNHNPKLISQLVDAGYISMRHDNVCHVTQAGAARLSELRVLIVQVELVESRLDGTNHILERTQQDLSDYKQQCDKQYQSDAMQARFDKIQLRRHDYKVAAFTVAFTLFLEHFPDLIKLMKILF